MRARALRHDPGGLRAAGLPAYEISNHARPGAECRHNLVYWRGAGICRHRPGRAWPARHRRRQRTRTATEKRPEAWLMRVEANGHGLVTDDHLNSEERADEFLLMGLRLAEGIDPARYTALAGRAARSAPDRDAARGGRDRRRRRRPAARDARRISRCSTPWSRISRRSVVRALVPAPRAAPNARRSCVGARLRRPACRRRSATFITARPRSLVPSERNRNRPSMPAKPEGLVSVSGEKRCAPCVLTSAATSATAS